MAKTIILDDLTYTALKKEARKEDRSISKTAKRLIQLGLQAKTISESMTGTGVMTAAMASAAGVSDATGVGTGMGTGIPEPKYYTIEEFNEIERKRIEAKKAAGWKPEKIPDMSDEELMAVNQKFKGQE